MPTPTRRRRKPRKVTAAKRIANITAAALDDGHNLEAPVTVTLTRDKAGRAVWYEPTPTGSRRPRATRHGEPGEEVTVPGRAAIRLAALGWVDGLAPSNALSVLDGPALGDEEAEDLEALAEPTLEELELEQTTAALGPDGDAAAAEDLAKFLEGAGDGDATPPEASDLDDEALAAKDAAELVGHLTQFPADAARVLALEEQRKPSARRSSVLDAIAVAGLEDEAAALRPTD